MLAWLMESGLGPALVAVPVNFTAEALAGAAERWFRRLRRTDGLSRLVRAATGTSVDLTHAEFDAVRRMLEDQQTWNVAGRGSIDDLAARIASCMPPRDGRSPGDSAAAAMTIAHGLLEFAVADLDPKVFQQVLLARLARMEAQHASALDEALFALHADLIDRLVAQGDLDAERFASVMGQLRRVLDQLPPGPAQRGEIAVYLRTLIDWLNADPWPGDRRFGGPVLSPAAIERKLRITNADTNRDWASLLRESHNADELVKRCRRLVVLGDPGSGKTWLAKRTARLCAENALEALAASSTLDNIELPLYTTCSRLFAADGDIREAAVSSALDQLGDLGSSRLRTAIQMFFTERNAPTILVIDSLDEAHGSDERLRQADTLPWRILLTSRPSTWNNQLVIEEGNDSYQVGELWPLSYPEDVEPFIYRWFEESPQRGTDLAIQIARRPELQRAATVPLILAFYCIVGGGEPLPEFRRQLYSKVLSRLLTGRWRSGSDRQPDFDACLDTLRTWAWSGAVSHPDSGVGSWEYDIHTGRSTLRDIDQEAVDHIATPLGPTDLDTRKTARRFIHWSIREHLVAEYVATVDVTEAAKILLPHIWFDYDWEYAIAAALAMHPRNDQLLRKLIHLAADSELIANDLSAIDAGWEFRRLLARVASESNSNDWSPEMAELISQARIELALSGHTDNLTGTASWESSNSRIRQALLGLLDGQNSTEVAIRVVEGLIRLTLTEEDKRRVSEVLLRLLTLEADGYKAARLARAMVPLVTAQEDKRRATAALLSLMTNQANNLVVDTFVSAVVQMVSTEQDKRHACGELLRLLIDQTDSTIAEELVNGIIQLAPTREDKRRAREALLALLTDQTSSDVAARLAVVVAQLDPTDEDMRRARDALLTLASHATEPVADDLVRGIVRFSYTAEDKWQACEVLLSLLADRDNSHVNEDLVAGIVQLASTAEDRRQARAVLCEIISQTDLWGAKELVDGVIQLALTTEDKRQASQTLLGLLADYSKHWIAKDLVAGIAQLASTAEGRRQAEQALLRLLARPAEDEVAARLVDGLVGLATTVPAKRETFETFLELLTGQTAIPVHEDLVSESARPAPRKTSNELVRGVVQLAATDEEKDKAREVFYRLLADQNHRSASKGLVDGIIQLAQTAEDRRQARETLLGMLASEASEWWQVGDLVRRIIQLAQTAEDRRQARKALVGMLVSETCHSWQIGELVAGIMQLTPTVEDQRQARKALLGMLCNETFQWQADELVGRIVELTPTADDRRQVRQALLRLLNEWWTDDEAAALAGGIVLLRPTPEEMHRARCALIRLGSTGGELTLTPESKCRIRRSLLWRIELPTDPWAAIVLTAGLALLEPTSEDRDHANRALLELLTDGRTDELAAAWLVDAMVQLDSKAKGRRRTREILLGLLTSRTDEVVTARLTAGIARTALLVRDRRQTRQTMLGLLIGETNEVVAARLIAGIVQLMSTARDRRQARAALLTVLNRQIDKEVATQVARGIVQLGPTADERHQARAALIRRLAECINDWVPGDLLDAIVQLSLTSEDKSQAREMLLELLSRSVGALALQPLLDTVVKLAPAEEEMRQARETLLRLLANRTDHNVTAQLMDALVQFDPIVSDLSNWRAWATPPTRQLLAAVRRNSSVVDWLSFLPSLPASTA
jgi:NACHT domain